MSIDYSIGVTTYSKRFDDFFVPLIEKITNIKPNVEILVTVNGPVDMPFDSVYRKRILNFLADYDNVFPRFYPKFTSLSKTINECLVNSSNHHVLILNDDVDVHPIFFSQLDDFLVSCSLEQLVSFTVNGSFSHMFLDRREVHQLGYFDERLVGIGAEDVDFRLRYMKCFNRPFNSINFSGIRNLYDMTYNDKYAEDGHLSAAGGAPEYAQSKMKYSLANHQIIQSMYPTPPWPKWEEYGNMYDAFVAGVFDEVENLLGSSQQYPYEPFCWENKKLLYNA